MRLSCGYNRIVNFLDANLWIRSRNARLLSLSVLLGVVVGCTEDPAGTTTDPTRVAGEVRNDAAQFATPTPRVLITPTPEASSTMATPEPSAPPAATTAPTPTPTPVGASTAPSASPSGSASPYKKTGVATDLAVSGPGYFVLSTKADPIAVEDLLFTKDGHLTVEKDTSGAITVFRLRHGQHLFHLVGFSRSGGTGVGAPGETSTPGAVLAAEWGGVVPAAGLALDADRNPEAGTKLTFDYTGKLRVAEVDPRGTDGAALQAYVAIAQVDDPDALVPQPGFDGVFKYQDEAGTLRLGVAVTGTGRPVGNANLVLTGTLEP